MTRIASAFSLMFLMSCASAPVARGTRCERECEDTFAQCIHDYPQPEWCESDLGECLDGCL